MIGVKTRVYDSSNRIVVPAIVCRYLLRIWRGSDLSCKYSLMHDTTTRTVYFFASKWYHKANYRLFMIAYLFRVTHGYYKPLDVSHCTSLISIQHITLLVRRVLY